MAFNFDSDDDASVFSGFGESDIGSDVKLPTEALEHEESETSDDDVSDDEPVHADGWTSNFTDVPIDDFTETPGPNFPDDFDVDHATPLDYFWLVFPIQLITLIVQHTNAYAQWVQARDGFDSFWHETSEAEMRAFLAINVLMGIQQLPEISMYWSSPSLATQAS
ncbi:uncharacterized protein LOC128213698 isoform X2 [Mya arenaria]|uniref:uncharacterized protein LOC128213698 isoform X2 n=1 Tax=Mya arenaria TaxID=6604 RepID=UPI0022E55F52|nr:uncharacterized protein LOC128213698 isoform X2 [Mya arenaria]